MAPPITPASAGFQVPSAMPPKSRNPSTTAGSTMPEIASPAPNSRPLAKAPKVFMQGTFCGHHQDRNQQENCGGGDRARRQPRQAAHAMAAGAAIRQPRADADKQSGGDQQQARAGQMNRHLGATDGAPQQQSARQTGQERHVLRPARRPAPGEFGGDPADAGDPPGAQHEQARRGANQHAAGKAKKKFVQHGRTVYHDRPTPRRQFSRRSIRCFGSACSSPRSTRLTISVSAALAGVARPISSPLRQYSR